MLRKIFQIILLTGLLLNLAEQAESQQKKRQTRNTTNRNVQQKDLTAEQIAKKFLPSIVLIVCDDGKGKFSQGSGFFIRDGIILTNYHVIKGMVRGKLKTVSADSKANEWWIEKVLYIDSKNDLALLSILPEVKLPTLSVDINSVNQNTTQVKRKKLPKESVVTQVTGETGGKVTYEGFNFPPVLKLSESDKVTIGEKIYVLSNPEGLTGTLSQGIVSSDVRKINDIELLQIDAPISQGSSGGAVLNVRGEVIGIAVGSLSVGQNLNFAVPLVSIKSFLGAFDSPPTPIVYSSSTQVTNGWLSEVKNVVTDINSTNQATKTEEKTETKNLPNWFGSFDEVAGWLTKTLENTSVLTGRQKIKIDNLSFSQCTMNYSATFSSSENSFLKQSYTLNLKYLKEVYPVGDNELKAIRLSLNERVLEQLTESDGGISYSLVNFIVIPANDKYRDDAGVGFEVLRRKCSNEQNTSKITFPSLKETTDWLTNTIEATKFVSSSLIYKYERLRFSHRTFAF